MTMQYTQSNLEQAMNRGIQGKVGMLISKEDTMNEAVRNVVRKIDLRTLKRKVTLTPNLFGGIFEYTCPSDLKAKSIIDIPAQASRQDGEFNLITPEEFRVGKNRRYGDIAIDDYNGQRVLLINSEVQDQSITIDELDGVGDWVVFGDAENLTSDNADYVKGAGSLKFDINSDGGTTAGIQNTSLTSFDMTEYFGGTSAFFIYHKISDVTDLSSVTLRFGNDITNFYEKTVTSQADGTAFVNGWNLLKVDVSSLSETGTVTKNDIKYMVAYMNKTATKISESDYKFDWIVLKKGVIHNIHYYGKYGWQDSSGAYKENSDSPTDLLVADTDEFELIVSEARLVAAKEVDLTDSEIAIIKNARDEVFTEYLLRNPSEAKIMTTGYYDFN